MASLQRVQPILTSAKDACRQLCISIPAALFNTEDETGQLMGSLANLAGVLLADNYNWQHLQKTLEIIPDGVQTEFALPDDFSSFVDNTGWSYAIRRPVVVLNAQQWASISTWLSQSFYINPACRIISNKLQFMTAPAANGKITFQYKVRWWVVDGADATILKDVVTRDADIPQFDWLIMVLALKVKWLEGKKMDTTAAQSDLNDRYFQLTGKDLLAPTLYLGGPVSGGFRYLDNFSNTPDTNLGV